MKKYLHNLKQNRERKAKQMLEQVFESSNLSMAEHGETIFEGMIKDFIPLQSRTRGAIFEVMAEGLIGNTFDITDFKRQRVYHTPFGKRKIDLYSPKREVIIEIKSGYARLNKSTRLQINKDGYIRDNEPGVNHVVWFCFRGATAPLTRYLEKNNIEVIDLEYDKLPVEDDDEINKVTSA